MKTELTLPKTSKQEVLYTLITKGRVSIMDFPYLSGFRTRVSEFSCREGLKMRREKIKSYNKFGNSYTYVVHILEDTEQAIELYKKMIKEN